jgi:hypothetical protein
VLPPLDGSDAAAGTPEESWDPITPARGRAVVPDEPDPVAEAPVLPPVAARTILPSRETGLFRRRSVPPVETTLPQAPRHAVPPPVRPAAAPMYPLPAEPAAPVPAPMPVRIPAPAVQVPPAPPVVAAPPAPPVVAAPPVPAASPAVPPAGAVPRAAPVSLPTRGARHESPAPAAVATVAELSPLAQLSQLASASYTPEVVKPTEEETVPVQRTQPDAEPITLARRQPAAPPQPVRDTEDAEPSRPRAAGDVRSMLSGFRAGVQRGRDGAHTTRPAHGVDNLRRD